MSYRWKEGGDGRGMKRNKDKTKVIVTGERGETIQLERLSSAWMLWVKSDSKPYIVLRVQ